MDDDYLDHRGAYVRQWDITRIISRTELLDYMFGHGFFCVGGGEETWAVAVPTIAGVQMATRKAANLT